MCLPVRYIVLFLFSLLVSTVSYATIKVGTVVFDPPYVFSLNQGFDIDLMKLICSKINQKCEFTAMDYDLFPAALANGSIDVAIDGLPFNVNSSNEGFIFSEPYLLSKGQFLGLKSSKISKISDIPVKAKVGIVEEATEVNFFYDFFTKKYGSTYRLVSYRTLESVIEALKDGKITSAFLDNNEANYWMLNGGDHFVLIGEPMRVADGIGIMASPRSQALIQNINQAILGFEKNQQYLNLYRTYMGLN